MRIGLFADAHDHLDNIRQAVGVFNSTACDQVLFAGDLVSTIAIPPLRALRCPFLGCFGDNEGNKLGLRAGISIVGQLVDGPFVFKTAQGPTIALAHMRRQLRELVDAYDLAIVGHTHKARLSWDERKRPVINPGETAGWSFGCPTVAILEWGRRVVTWIDLRTNSQSKIAFLESAPH